MADIALSFFNPTDVLNLGGDWIQQENNITHSLQRAQGLGATGDEAANKTHGGGSAGSVVYECHAETGNLTLPNAGKVAGGVHIDNMQLTYQPSGWPRLTCNVHQHDDNAHADTLNQFVGSVTLPAQFGIPTTVLTGVPATCGLKGLTYTLGCTHQDEDVNGNHLAGENRDGIETLSVEATGDIGDAVDDPTDFDSMSDGDTKSNTAVQGTSLAWEKHIARYVAP